MFSPIEQKEYEEDFIKSKPNLTEYIRKLQQWRDKYERLLDARPRVQSLDNLSHYLIEFQYTKFDEVEIPGQYTEVGLVPLYATIFAKRRAGQGQQPQFRPHSSIRSEIRELSFAWLLLEASDHQGP